MILNNLTPEQLVAVKRKGHVLLSACPGSGKTRTIIHKLAYESSQLDSKSKKKVVAVTFTVRASDEIFNRLNRMDIDKSKVWSGTLHSFCLNWLIKPYGSYLTELKDGYTLADESFKKTLLDTITQQYQENYSIERSVDLYIDNSRLRRDGSFDEQNYHKRQVLETYHQELNKNKIIDFDLLLYYSYNLLDTYPTIGKVLSNLFQLICIDEYQDTQDLSYAIICNIINAGNGNTSLFLAGDSDQSIYYSLGGIVKNKVEIEAELNGQQIAELSLTGNFRSTQRIIDYYNSFKSNPIPIVATGNNQNDQGTITHNHRIHKSGLVAEIARLIQVSIDNCIPENEICILVPQWWLITSIARQLKTVLPDTSFDATGLAPMSKNRDNFWYKLSRLFLTEPGPNIYVLRHLWARELLDSFHEHTGTHFFEPYNLERNILRLANSISSTETEAIPYLEDCFNQFNTKIGINIDSLITLKNSWDIYFRNINNRLTDPEYDVPSDIISFKNLYKERNGIVINTCVGIKGEEFETVIAFGLLKGFVPHWNDIFSNRINEIESSKKLMYVICSRAKKNLHLISEQGRVTRRGAPLEITPVLRSKQYSYD